MANAKETSVSNDKFVAYIERFDDVAVVTVFQKLHREGHGKAHYEIDWGNKLSCYETLSSGAMASARREIEKLSAQVAA